MKKNLVREIINILAYRFNLDEDKAKENEIIESLKKNIEFKGTNLWTLIFAIFIASIGLNVNSPAVIIGAMLISPLMGPIMGIGLGAGIFDFRIIRYSLKNLLIAIIISILTSALYFWLSPIHSAKSELLARTAPTLWDVLIAFFGGLAGIIASSRKNISNVIPGVAIATALMPPLCTAGYGIGTGNFYYFAGAFYLFLINSVFISISTFLIVRFLKFKPVEFVDQTTERKVRKYIWFIALLTILPSLYLAYRFVNEEIFKQNLKRFISSEIELKGLYVINQKIDPRAKNATLLIYGENTSDSLLSVINSNRSLYGLLNSEIRLQSTLTKFDSPSPEITVQPGFDKQLNIIIEKDLQIKSLEKKISQLQYNDSTLKGEFQALFGPINEISISKAAVYNRYNKGDTMTLVYIKPRKRMLRISQIQHWLTARYNTKKVRLIID